MTTWEKEAWQEGLSSIVIDYNLGTKRIGRFNFFFMKCMNVNSKNISINIVEIMNTDVRYDH